MCNSPTKEKHRSKCFAIQVTATQVSPRGTKAAVSVASSKIANKKKRKTNVSSSARTIKEESSSIECRKGRKLKIN